MRFDDLFGDLEGQLEAELASRDRATAAEEERFRLGRLELRDRLLASPGALDLRLRSGERLRVERIAVGRDWLSGTVRDGAAEESGCLVPIGAIVGIRLDVDAAMRSTASHPSPSPSPPRLADRLSLAFALRDLARRRVPVEVRGGAARHGTIDRVGRDHLDLALHEAGVARHPRAVDAIELVPFQAIDWLRIP